MMWPRSLLARNALLIGALVVVGQIVSIVCYVWFVQLPRAAQIAGLTARYVDLLEAAAVDTPRSVLAGVSERDGLPLIRFEREGPPEAEKGTFFQRRALVRAFLAEIRRRMGGREVALVSNPQPTLWISMQVAGERVWFVADADALLTEHLSNWLTFSAIGALIGIGGAVLIQRRINRPLGDLVQAAQDVGAGSKSVRLEEDGPAELSSVAKVFNAMVSDLAAVDKNRAMMLAGISHDVRTPLTRIRLVSELLRGSAEPELLDRIDANLDRVDRIMAQFLSFARDEASEAPVYVKLNAHIEDCLDEFRRDGAQIVFDRGDVPDIHARPLALARAVENLVANAVTHGAPPVSVSTAYGDGIVSIVVTDCGRGIPDADIELQKQPFRRNAPEGTGSAGLGLAIVDRVARLHGGSLRLANRTGGGLAAEILLPV
jgi:two-component system osmolarity sensor histidine kinase EnvZ